MKFAWRDVYGRRLFYPLDDAARAVSTLVGRSSLSARQLHALRALGAALGFTVTLEPFPEPQNGTLEP